MIQVFVKNLDSRTLTVSVDERGTVDTLMQEVAEKSGWPQDTFYLLPAAGGPLMDGRKTLAECGIRGESTLTMRPRKKAPDYDPEVRPILANTVTELLERSAREPMFVLICLGCYDHGHGEESIRRQQCPDGLLDACAKAGFRVAILLIDSGFADTDGAAQIYTIDHGWRETGKQKKVVSYAHPTASAELTTFATSVLPAEYAGEAPTLAGTDLERGFRTDKGSCLVVGNFYDRGNPAHITLGDEDFIRRFFPVR